MERGDEAYGLYASKSQPEYIITVSRVTFIRESVDSLCRDGADMPRVPYIGKACTCLNGESLSLFRGLAMVLK